MNRDVDATRSWFGVDGGLEPIDFDGPSYFRFPEAVVEFAIRRYSSPGDWVIDPFCGFGTTLVVAERMGRHAIGIEVDPDRAGFAASRAADAGSVFVGRAEDVVIGGLPAARLLLTSPPYGSFRDGNVVDDPQTYCADALRIFHACSARLTSDATIVVEVAQERKNDVTRPLVWHLGLALSGIFSLVEDVVRVNTGVTDASIGYQHSHLLVFRR